MTWPRQDPTDGYLINPSLTTSKTKRTEDTSGPHLRLPYKRERPHWVNHNSFVLSFKRTMLVTCFSSFRPSPTAIGQHLPNALAYVCSRGVRKAQKFFSVLYSSFNQWNVRCRFTKRRINTTNSSSSIHIQNTKFLNSLVSRYCVLFNLFALSNHPKNQPTKGYSSKLQTNPPPLLDIFIYIWNMFKINKNSNFSEFLPC